MNCSSSVFSWSTRFKRTSTSSTVASARSLTGQKGMRPEPELTGQEWIRTLAMTAEAAARAP